jgi:hypothetical protein
MWATLLRCPSAAACPQCHWLRPFGWVYGFVACSPRLDRSGGRYGSGGRGQRRRRWGPRTLQSATIFDRVVSQVTVTDPRHSLFGSKLAALPERSARGPTYIVVQLSDGRRRSIRVSSTDLGEPPIAWDSKGSAVPQISLRTLIPLTRHLNASLALLAKEVIRDGPTHPSRTRCVSATPAPGMPAPPVGKKSSAPMVEVASRDAKAGSPGSGRVDTANASRRRRIRKGDHPC